jgi:hypothetical protein
VIPCAWVCANAIVQPICPMLLPKWRWKE